jgi:hypothetical protein
MLDRPFTERNRNGSAASWSTLKSAQTAQAEAMDTDHLNHRASTSRRPSWIETRPSRKLLVVRMRDALRGETLTIMSTPVRLPV